MSVSPVAEPRAGYYTAGRSVTRNEPDPGARVSCPTCQNGLSPGLAACPDCGAPNPLFDAVGSTQTGDGPTFRLPGQVASRPPAGAAADRPLGFVVVYAESSEAAGTGPATSLGRAWPLKAGEVFFAGKVLKDATRADGGVVKPAAWHLFPFTEDYAHISRHHLTVEFEANGNIRLCDTSANGTWLTRGGVHLRRGRDESRVHTLAGDEALVLGVDLGANPDARAREKASRYTLQLIRAGRSLGGAA